MPINAEQLTQLVNSILEIYPFMNAGMTHPRFAGWLSTTPYSESITSFSNGLKKVLGCGRNDYAELVIANVDRPEETRRRVWADYLSDHPAVAEFIFMHIDSLVACAKAWSAWIPPALVDYPDTMPTGYRSVAFGVSTAAIPLREDESPPATRSRARLNSVGDLAAWSLFSPESVVLPLASQPITIRNSEPAAEESSEECDPIAAESSILSRPENAKP